MISSPLNLKVSKKEGNRVVFEIEGLYPGYGTTIGNSMRRVLFSSLSGAAITQIKIDGAQHEFSAIEGVYEDVITMILNLKKMRFKMHTDEPQTITLDVKGEKDVKGSDFKVPSQLELINKEEHIATLTDKKSELKIEAKVEKGMGYLMANQEKREKLEVGEISIDAIFTPIKNINFRVETMRVGKRTDFDRLFLDVETDGTIDAEEALKEGASILVDFFSLIAGEKNNQEEEQEKEIEVGKETDEQEADEKEKDDDAGKTKIEDTKISARTVNILIKNGIKTVSGLSRKSEEAILTLDGMGDKGLKEIKKELKKLGIELKSDVKKS